MFSTLTAILPIFSLIFAGWVARRTGVVGLHASGELNRFVVYLALPTLLFDVIAHAQWADVWQPSFIAAFGIGAALVFCLTIAVRWRGRRQLVDAAIDGLNAGYANTGFVGFPLAVAALGREALAPTLIATIITVCMLFASAIVLIETGLQTEKRRRHVIIKVGRSLLLNPLLVAPALGAIIPLAGLNVPGPAENFLKLLGGAASPCALVALGLFLAAKRDATEQDIGSAALLVGFKLVLQPAVTWVMATLVFGLSPLLTHTAVLLAALPTGTGPFMLAEFYRREASMTSNVILASTIVSVVTLSLYLAVAR
ncbi:MULTISPECIES: AEC family transporter [unclassified Bradyrhizobium]|uniref:AEC family transporter n=1 Tax=unclassified Bradyrhizobium TaxID=2631580 RepID=UPI0024791846|nr:MULTISPECIES: AEC family transporter [unclassified Bradyrhizobium]WGS17678.1 AEC family transporter [Bradyrhizobium sp. ISRA463]WGS24469.1 AEC family transporter [Bradyrhizobium sp. ISRA464]